MSDPISDGTDPFNDEFAIAKYSRSLINPISDGIVFAPLDHLIINEVSEQNMPRSVGIGPIKFRTNMNYYVDINITQTQHTTNTQTECFHY